MSFKTFIILFCIALMLGIIAGILSVEYGRTLPL